MRKVTIFIVLSFLLVLCAAPAYAQPALPHAFYGSVTINGGSPAPDGSRVSATVDQGDIIATQNPVTTSGGNYGVDSLKLLVQGDIPNGATITFYVNDVSTDQTATFEASGGPTRVDLAVTIPRRGDGGGISVDRTPPRISDISSLCGAITETTADICWKTQELSDSQVEYRASPSMFSELDEAMVINHHIRLIGLTPGTTYYYKTMSRDRAGNLAVSVEYTFTTLGTPPAAQVSELQITPGEVDIGVDVTISVLVLNISYATRTYDVSLKIDNVTVATEEVTVAGGASESVTFTVSRDVAATYAVSVDGLSGSFVVKPPPAPPAPAPAAFAVRALTISPAEVDIGGTVTIGILVTNTGDLAGSYQVTLKIDEAVVATKGVTLDGGASQSVTFTVSRDVVATHTISIDGLTGTFVVKPPPAEPINWPLVGGIIVAVTAAATTLFLLLRRRAWGGEW